MVTLGPPASRPHSFSMALLLLITAFVAALTPPVMTQAPPPPPPAPPAYGAGSSADLARYQADQHRYEMDRLRAQADQREAFARQLELETRINRQRLEAARQPEPVQPPAWRALRSPEEERTLRRAAEERRRATVDGTSQIDRWLDRPRD